MKSVQKKIGLILVPVLLIAIAVSFIVFSESIGRAYAIECQEENEKNFCEIAEENQFFNIEPITARSNVIYGGSMISANVVIPISSGTRRTLELRVYPFLIIGGIMFLIIVALTILYFYKKRKNKK
ncbi:MAG: hypothetical protein FWC80_05920 [Firmicutes bacterium]|nr:hypothetical protein [Bacillota bacterium]